MEGIFILKVIGDTNFQKITKEPQIEINNIIKEFSNKGYPFSSISLLKTYKVSDTIFLFYKFEKNFPYIIKKQVFENYYSKTLIYKKFMKSFENKIFIEKDIKLKLHKLDNFYNLKSSFEIYENFLKFENKKIPMDGFGGLTLIDSSINGNLDVKFDFLSFSYNRNFLNIGFEFALPFEFLNKFVIRYYNFLEYKNVESFLNVNGYFGGFRFLNEKLGIFGGYENNNLNIRIDALNFFYRFYFLFNNKFFNINFSINQIDKNVIGGSKNILGYSENSITCNNYFLISIHYPLLIFIPIIQFYWIDKSNILYSYGIGIGNENSKILFIINGREKRPYLHFIIKS
ncbi:MAG: hypothetical protein ABIL78_03925 [candidate division WOR-3 bacterium]